MINPKTGQPITEARYHEVMSRSAREWNRRERKKQYVDHHERHIPAEDRRKLKEWGRSESWRNKNRGVQHIDGGWRERSANLIRREAEARSPEALQ